MDPHRRFGLGKGKVYPASAARGLVNPLRHLIHPPGRLANRAIVTGRERVLELGCGPGWFSGALARRLPGGRLCLADLQTEMLRSARARAPGAAAVAVDATALPFAEGIFDAVILAAVLGEVPDVPGALSEVRRVMASHGRLVVLETRTDPDFIRFDEMSRLAAAVGLGAANRHGRVGGYTAIFTASGGDGR